MTFESPAARLHHHAIRTRDMAATRRFYEDVIGMPLTATWVEQNDLPGPDSNYIHCFFELRDGSALAFFQFADDDARPDPEISGNPFEFHLALAVKNPEEQARVKERLEQAKALVFEVDHGYCQSLYTRDPNGMTVEFACDPPDIDAINDVSRDRAHRLLDNWLEGDRTVTTLRDH